MSANNKIHLYILIILASLSFYNPLGLVPPLFGKLFFYLISLTAIVVALRQRLSLYDINFPKGAYTMLMWGLLTSIIMVTFFQHQTFLTTIVATLPYLFAYSLFYVLMKLNIPKKQIEKCLWAFCLIGMVVYLVNIISFPNMLFGVEKDEYDMSRGIIRLSVPSLTIITLCFFYSINQWMISHDRKYIWIILLTFTFIVLSVTRQHILLSTLFGLLFVMQKASWTKKICVAMTCVLLFIFVLPKIPIYQTMVELSESQLVHNQYEEEDIRIQAWRFYTYEYQTNTASILFGNGIPSLGKSQWGIEVEQTISPDYGGNRCFAADVGWAGFFWYFGLFATTGLFILLAKGIKKKKQLHRQYLSYWLMYTICAAITSGPILYYHQIIIIMTVLYLVYGKENNSGNNTQLQQL